ncbi:Rieske (2Fe-2S) protein [Streptacidiphilus sp. EB129]|uniref:Rieske (2Fe-2S) protein n=1 Tax=Streptacidiphilus sp. EB129 TaxID=3156262 RepID=UPI003515F2F6
MSQPATSPSPDTAAAADCAGCSAPSRRGVLRGAAAVGVVGAAGVALAACSTSSASDSSAASGPVTLGPVSAVPVGGGTVYRSQQIVVTQPTAGTYKAFSAVCTHAGCIVDGVSSGTIQCPCHGSAFHITDGSVANGPAQTPLPAYPVTVQGGKLVVTT